MRTTNSHLLTHAIPEIQTNKSQFIPIQQLLQTHILTHDSRLTLAKQFENFKNLDFPYFRIVTTLDERKALGEDEHHNPKTA